MSRPPHVAKLEFRDEPEEPPAMTFEVVWVTGHEAVGLRREQAAAIREVLTWLVQQRSKHGPDHAA